MKKCPICGSLDQGSDITCGICGHDLSQVSPFIEEGVPIPAPQSRPSWHINIPGFLGLFAGLALVGFGAYLLYTATSYVGAFLFLISVGIGISVIGITRDFVENRRYTGIGIRGSRFSHGFGPIRDERKVEDEEDKRRASGEED